MVRIKSDPKKKKKIGKVAIIGCGTIGGAFAHFLSKNHPVILYDKDPKRTKALSESFHATVAESIAEAIASAEFVILAVKPQSLAQAAPQIASVLTPQHILVSVMAGKTIHRLKHYFKNSPIVRIMPNLAITKGTGAIAIAEGTGMSSQIKSRLEAMLGSLGQIFWIPEDNFDAFTALAASGPAFALEIIEAMVDAAVAMGFSHEKGLEIILQMLMGSISLLKDNGRHPGELKWLIVTPSGTTIAGLNRMKAEKVSSGVIQTFLAAFARAQELSAKE